MFLSAGVFTVGTVVSQVWNRHRRLRHRNHRNAACLVWREKSAVGRAEEAERAARERKGINPARDGGRGVLAVLL